MSMRCVRSVLRAFGLADAAQVEAVLPLLATAGVGDDGCEVVAVLLFRCLDEHARQVRGELARGLGTQIMRAGDARREVASIAERLGCVPS